MSDDERMGECYFCGDRYPEGSGYLFSHPNGQWECERCRRERLRREQQAERERALRRRGEAREVQ